MIKKFLSFILLFPTLASLVGCSVDDVNPFSPSKMQPELLYGPAPISTDKDEGKETTLSEEDYNAIYSDIPDVYGPVLGR